jgi:site-specific DNA-methyltransferase (adenine-specific)
MPISETFNTDCLLLEGDCKIKLLEIESNSVDSCVTDAPYELGFMGKSWDNTGIAYDVEMWKEVYRVLKPGAFLLSFGGTRTYHRMACAIEDAGFEIRDMIEWVYGSGFPKSLDIGKAVDKLQGNEREVVGKVKSLGGRTGKNPFQSDDDNFNGDNDNNILTKGTSEFEGWGTAMKPAHEPICVARKPLSEKTVAENVLKWGTGGINIDKSRIETAENLNGGAYCENKQNDGEWGTMHQFVGKEFEQPSGRFPANIITDGSKEVVSMFPYSTSGEMNTVSQGKSYGIYGKYNGHPVSADKSEGSASRFFKVCEFTEEDFAPLFYTAKASGEERNSGCRRIGRNTHATVKPLSLIKYLITLITPKGGTVLDPFAGSGTTPLGAKELGFNYIAIEKEPEHIEIIKARLSYAIPLQTTLF